MPRFSTMTWTTPLGRVVVRLAWKKVVSLAWGLGEPFDPDEAPRQALQLETADGAMGDCWPDYYRSPMPLMSDALLAIVEANGGRQHIELYPVEIDDRREGAPRRGYTAVNFTRRHSKAEARSKKQLPPIFWLTGPDGGAVGNLIVSDEIRRAAEDAGLETLRFDPLPR